MKTHALTSCDSHCMHFWSSIGSGVCTYLHTGQLQEKYIHIYIQRQFVFIDHMHAVYVNTVLKDVALQELT